MNGPLPELRLAALAALLCPDPMLKASLAQGLPGLQHLQAKADLQAPDIPGRPERPLLVPPHKVPRRRAGSATGRAALLHAVAHIEFNAINLALDAVVRFSGLPSEFYLDWATVAAEESQHFLLLAGHLVTLGQAYGDFPAHDGLWEAARKTAGDPLARMALVPRVLEARGLDVTPGMQARLREAGDLAAADILARILHDEIGHVAVGNRWYRWLCAERGLEPIATFRRLCADHGQSLPRPPFNLPARLAGGFAPEELAGFEGTPGNPPGVTLDARLEPDLQAVIGGENTEGPVA